MARHPTPHMVFEMAPHTALHMVPLCEMNFIPPVMDVLSTACSLRMILTVTVNRSRGRVFHYYLFFHHAHSIHSFISHKACNLNSVMNSL
jgi:hypothetical protein